jgi:hypothetical protein
MPIFLIWLYVAWTVVLFSLEVAFVHQHRQLGWLGKRMEQISPAERFLFGLEIYFQIVGRFYRGEPPPSINQIARRFSASLSDISYFIDLFQEKDLLLRAGRHNDLLVPTRSLERTYLQQLFRSLFGNPVEAPWQSEEALSLFESVTGAAVRSLDQTSVLEFLKSSLETSAEERLKKKKTSRRPTLDSLLDWSALRIFRRKT